MRRQHGQEDQLHHLLKDKIPSIKRVIDEEQSQELKGLVKDLHPSEIAYVIQYLDFHERELFVSWLKHAFNAKIFLWLSEDLLPDILRMFSYKEIAGLLNTLESDEALQLLKGLPQEQQQDIIESMPAGKRYSLNQRLRYPSHSAGRLMQQEMLTFSQQWTVEESLAHLQQIPEPPLHLHEAFVLNSNHQPIGSISLSRLLRSDAKATLEEIMSKELHAIPVTMEEKEIVFIFRLYDLVCAPVINEENDLLGMITLGDIMDVVERNANEELLHMGGVHTSDFYESVFKSSLSRIHWLVVTLLNTLLTSLVIYEFQGILQETIVLAALMPIAAAMGGNSGIQSSTIVIRALAMKELSSLNILRTFFKEFRVVLLNGSFFALFLGGLVYLWYSQLTFSLVLGGAVFFNMVWSGIAGTFLPVLVTRLGYDPALSCGPVLTTTTDVIGYVLFLGLAKLLLH